MFIATSKLVLHSVLLARFIAIAFLLQSAAASDPIPDAKGWFDLFDGQTLTGWHANPEPIVHGSGGQWTVEPGGVLAGEQDPPGSGNGGILLTDRQFGDFELSLEMWPTWGVDSGVFLRSTDKGQCIQMTVDYYQGGNIGHLYGEGTGGWLARAFSIAGIVKNGRLRALRTINEQSAAAAGLVDSCTGEEWLKVWKINDWNRALIRVERGRLPVVTTYINDLKVCVLDAARFRGKNYDPERVARLLGERGSIALQVHGGGSYPPGAKCRWRNIRIREL